MKKILLLFIAVLCFSISNAQTDSLRLYLDNLFGTLDKTQVPSGYLAAYGMDIADKDDFNGQLSDSNIVNSMDIVRLLYGDIYTSRFNTTAPVMPTIDAVNTAINGAADNSLVIFYGQYSDLREDALQQNLFQYTGGRLFDVAGRSQSPYILKNLFAAFTKNKFFTNTVTLHYNPSLFYTNTGSIVTQLQVDFGSGYQTIIANGDASHTYYDSSGVHLIHIKMQLSNGTTQITSMVVNVQLTAGGGANMMRYIVGDLSIPDIEIAPVAGMHSGARVYIRRSIHTPVNQILKPLIVVEGLDIHDAAPELQDNYDVNELINEWKNVLISGQEFDFYLDDMAGYDLIFIDWRDGTDAVTRNAVLLEDVIGRINSLKANSGSIQQNVVMGISMGGLVARYCLASMTKRSVDPQTRLLITHDSPHQGAYVPLSFQHLIMGLQNVEILGMRLGGVMKGSLDQAVTLLQSPGAQNQLLMVVTNGSGTVSQNTFLQNIYRPMITFHPNDPNFPNEPQPQYEFVATSQGSQCGTAPLSVGAILAAGSAEGSISGPAMGLTAGIIWKWKYKVEIDAKALTGNSSHQILHFLLQRKQKLFWGIVNNDKTFANINRNEPSFNSIPWESVPGGVESLADRLNLQSNTISGNWSLIALNFLGYNYNFTLADRFGFVPLVSSLDIVNPNYTASSIFNITATPVTLAGTYRSAHYIAQRPFLANGSMQFNQPHTTFTARNAQWIFNEMENISQTYDCEDYCESNMSITGTSQICSSAIYRVNGLSPGATVTWSASPSNRVVFDCDTCAQTTVTRNGTGTVTLSAVVSGCGGGTPIEVVKSNINVGAPNTSSYKVIGPGTVYTYAYYYYSATGGPGSGTVSWSVPAGWSITNGQGTENITVYTGSTGGIVSINFTDVCGDPTGAYKTVVIGTGGPTPLKVSPLIVAVSPNPATNQVSISLQAAETINKQSTPDFISQIKIFDKMGTERKQFTYNDKKVSRLINIAGLPKDVYVVKVFTGNQWLSTQLIILK